MKLIIASNNLHKVNEIKRVISRNIELLTLADMGFSGEIPESEPTLEGNAILKAGFIYKRFRMNCFADDTGLEIEALQGAPGVYSARYAGEQCNSDDNVEKVLNAMHGASNRNARFRTVIALIINGEQLLFEGIVEGTIGTVRKGNFGFGYDPIFQPKGKPYTFAELTLDEKNQISHRAIAIKKLVNYLEALNP